MEKTDFTGPQSFFDLEHKKWKFETFISESLLKFDFEYFGILIYITGGKLKSGQTLS